MISPLGKAVDKDTIKKRIANLNKEIKLYFEAEKRTKIKRNIVLGSSKSLWQAVKIVKYSNISEPPNEMCNNKEPVANTDLPDVFADFL